jgi:hypothetical protein
VEDAKSIYLYFEALRIMYEEGEVSKEWLGVAIRHTAKVKGSSSIKKCQHWLKFLLHKLRY